MVKTPTDPINTKGVVYNIPCEYGRMYVGETRSTLKQRVTEHKRAVKNADSNNGLAVHVAKWIVRSDEMKLKLPVRTLNKVKDQREPINQAAYQQPQLRCWSNH